MRAIILSAFISTFALASACGQPASEDPTPSPASGGPAAAVSLAPAPAARPAAAHDEDDDVPPEKFTGGAKAFADVRAALLKSYYAEGLTEDDLYRAATAGMLEKLEPRLKKYNRLLAPTEHKAVKDDLKGELVGIGIQIELDEKSGYTDVLGALPKSPAEKAGLVAGDKIVTVNGKLYKGMKLVDVVRDIRGPQGEPVKLSVLRDGKLIEISVVRDRIAYDAPLSGVLAGGVGWLRIPSFTEKTPAAVRAALEELEQGGAKALIVDLRHSPGGSFDKAVETAELLLPEGTPIVAVKKRGKAPETISAKGKPVLATVPLAVLVDAMTASGAEFLAAALQEGRQAKLVGTRTTGKWSVQALDDLPNGYAVKYTVGLFQTPSGKSYEGTGITPDIEVSMGEGVLGRANTMKVDERLAVDVQLKTAKELLARAP